MSLSSKIAALRRLAERPGTEHEGIVAREMLARLEKKHSGPLPEGERWDAFRDFLRTGNMSDLDRACGYNVVVRCACGEVRPFRGECNSLRHEALRMEIATQFPVGTRVYYNAWAYPLNCAGIIRGKPRDQRHWNWYPVKFDHLKTGRSVPALDEHGWHLSTAPITEEVAMDLGWRNADAR